MLHRPSLSRSRVLVVALITLVASSGLIQALPANGEPPCDGPVFAEEVTFSGVVTDGVDPLPGVSVVAHAAHRGSLSGAAPGAVCATGETDAAGAFSLLLGVGCYHFVLTAPTQDFRPLQRVVCDADAAGSEWVVRTVDPRSRVVVEVRDAFSGEPVESATVQFLVTAAGPTPLPQDLDAAWGAPSTQITGADGRAEFLVPEGVPSEFLIESADHASRAVTASVADPVAAANAAALGGAKRLLGVNLFVAPVTFTVGVADALDAAAVDGASVTVAHDLPSDHPYVDACTTAASGECDVEMPAGAFDVSADHDDYAAGVAAVVIAAGGSAEIALDRTRVPFSGTVEDWFGAAVGAGSVTTTVDAFAATVAVGADGSFSGEAPWGEWSQSVASPGFETLVHEESVAPDAAEVSLAHTLVGAGLVGVDVTAKRLSGGTVIEGATVTVDGDAVGSTDSAGELAIEVPPLSEVCAHASGLSAACALASDTAGDAQSILLQLAVFGAPTEFSGKVVERLQTSTNVGHATTITATHSASGDVHDAATLNGQYSFVDVRDGGYGMVATNPCYAVGSRPFTANANQTTTVPPIELDRIAIPSFTVSLLDARSGAPVVDAQVRMKNDDFTAFTNDSWTAADGVATFVGLPWGNYTLTLAGGAGAYVTPTFDAVTLGCDVASGTVTADPASVTVELARRVVDLDVDLVDAQTTLPVPGEAPADAAVTLQPLDWDGDVIECSSDGAAAWECEDAEWGAYALTVIVPSTMGHDGRGYLPRTVDVPIVCTPSGTTCAAVSETVDLDHEWGALRVTARDSHSGDPIVGALVAFSVAEVLTCGDVPQGACDAEPALRTAPVAMVGGEACFYGADGDVQLVCEAVTDDAGEALLVLPWGDFALRVEADGFDVLDQSSSAVNASLPASSRVGVASGPETGVSIALRPATVAVHVRVESLLGDALAGAGVVHLADGCVDPLSGGDTVYSDGDGVAVFACTLPGAAITDPAFGGAVAAATDVAEYEFFVLLPPAGYTYGAGVAVVAPTASPAGAEPVAGARIVLPPSEPELPVPGCGALDGPIGCDAAGGPTAFEGSTITDGGDGPAGHWFVKPPRVERVYECAAAAASVCVGEHDGPADGTWVFAFVPAGGAASSYDVRLRVGSAFVSFAYRATDVPLAGAVGPLDVWAVTVSGGALEGASLRSCVPGVSGCGGLAGAAADLRLTTAVLQGVAPE